MLITESNYEGRNRDEIDEMFQLLGFAVSSQGFGFLDAAQKENLIDSFKQVLFTSHCFSEIEKGPTLSVANGAN